MKKTMIVMMVVACSMVILFSTFISSYMQAPESLRLKNGKNAADANTQSVDSASTQTSNSDLQETSKSEVTQNTNKGDNSCKVHDEETLSKCASNVGPTEANQIQILDSSVPFPDGRIFLRAFVEAEDPIPYIPTENPKMISNITIVPIELDT